MNINLREEETTSYLNFYQEYLESIQQLNNKVTDVLNRVMLESRYDRLQQRISQIIDTYTETIVGKVENGVFAAWVESQGSLRACLRAYRAGDAADGVCAQIEQTMGERMQDILKIEKADAIITDQPIVSADGLEQIEDVFRSARAELQDVCSEYVTHANSRNEENEIFGTLLPLFQGVASKIEVFLEASQNSFEELHEFVRSIAIQLHNIAEENGVTGSTGASDVPEARSNHQVASGSVPAASAAGDASDASSPDEDIAFGGENFTEENIKLFVVIVEKIVGQVGVDELNTSVEIHYNVLRDSRSSYSRKAKKNNTSSDHRTAASIYGRYTVTRESIQRMAFLCSQADSIFTPIDKFYKEKFEALGERFAKVNATIHTISTFCALFGLGALDLSEIFSSEDSESKIAEKIQLGGMALASLTGAGKLVNGGASLIKFLDYALPHFAKSKTLVKLSEKVWNLTRQDIQIPYWQKMMDQYMMEHYELTYGMKRPPFSYFEFYHSVVMSLEDDQQRRAFENAVFAGEDALMSYMFNETDPWKGRALCCGVFLNLVRSGMCSKEDIASGTANDIVDKLYDIYVEKDGVTPRVDISPDQSIIG